jgi:hypothetical protein
MARRDNSLSRQASLSSQGGLLLLCCLKLPGLAPAIAIPDFYRVTPDFRLRLPGFPL